MNAPVLPSTAWMAGTSVLESGIRKFMAVPLRCLNSFRNTTSSSPAGSAALPVSESVAGRVLSLPMYADLPAATQNGIAAAIGEILAPREGRRGA